MFANLIFSNPTRSGDDPGVKSVDPFIALNTPIFNNRVLRHVIAIAVEVGRCITLPVSTHSATYAKDGVTSGCARVQPSNHLK